MNWKDLGGERELVYDSSFGERMATFLVFPDAYQVLGFQSREVIVMYIEILSRFYMCYHHLHASVVLVRFFISCHLHQSSCILSFSLAWGPQLLRAESNARRLG